ncbi:LysE family translocator [Gallaecimonas mangrovi]|uniref:LysE family translocator n=1 Tax=Gallaecimonas mangrovi TaxID=2291597 RepID=UPI000E20AB39|nr:LysE family transporter [Gallaecimonas mangrovi]
MQDVMAVVAISGALAVGAMSPGPTFVVVARNAAGLSRQHGFATALGSGLGAAVFAVLALLGLHAVLAAVPMAFWALKIVGGCYLLFLAYKILRHAKSPLAFNGTESRPAGLFKTFLFGLMTQLSNPKTAIVFAGVFSALLPAHIALWLYLALPLAAFSVDTLWYVLVAFLLSAEKPRQTYLRAKTAIDRTAGAVMTLLGLKLLFTR